MPARQTDEPDGYREKFPESLRGRLPLLVRLRDFWEALPKATGGQELTLAQFEASLASWLQTRKPGGLSWPCLEDHVRRGAAFVIFDGVDEVPVSAGDDRHPWYPRAMLISGLAEAVSSWSTLDNRLLVTSRPYGLTDADRQRLRLHHAPISDLDDNLQRLLVRRWFGILANAEDTGTKRAGEFMEHLTERQDIMELLANPMLLTAVCIIYNEGKRLPQDRHELYSRIVDNVLYNRFRAPALIAMHRKQLCVIAHAMHTGEGTGELRSTPRAESSFDEIDRALSTYQEKKLYTEEGYLGVAATPFGALGRSHRYALAEQCFTLGGEDLTGLGTFLVRGADELNDRDQPALMLAIEYLDLVIVHFDLRTEMYERAGNVPLRQGGIELHDDHRRPLSVNNIPWSLVGERRK